MPQPLDLSAPARWRWPSVGRALMGIVNVTPDSFYEGGRRAQAEEAVALGVRMWEEGARYLDVGGESSRPGATPVSEAEELRRVLPVVEGLRAALPEVTLSVDTVKPAVAEAALRAGAHILNDIRGLRDPALRAIAAAEGAGVVIMHMRGTPQTMQRVDLSSEDIVAEVEGWLRERVWECEAEGIARESIALDPGVGFGKTPAQNLALLAALPRLEALGYPLLVGVSRKSYIGALTGAPAEARLPGTLATCAYAATVARARHQVWRVHDVAEARQALLVLEGLFEAEGQK
jgi:dihydropteroate synthase